MIRAYLVDDELNALKLLHLLLSELDGMEVVGFSDNPCSALEDIKRLLPDVVFLDIEMPEIRGLDLAEQIIHYHSNIHVVFVTAYDEYAVTAFEQDALDYLLKPIEEERLYKTVQRIKDRRNRESISQIKPTSMLTVNMLGQFTVYNEDRQPLVWRTAKEKELFALLVMYVEKGLHRDDIIQMMWENDDYDKAKIYLHTCISYLRNDFKKIGMHNMLRYSNGHYALDRERIVSDYEQLKSKMKKVRLTNDKQMVQVLKSVLTMYTGSLLQSCDYPWSELEKVQIDKEIADIQTKLAEHYYQNEDFIDAIQIAEQLVQSKSYNEQVYEMLMDCYKKIGRHDEVIRVKQLLDKILKELY